MAFPGGAVVKNAPADAGRAGLFSGSGRSPGVGHGNHLQYYCLEKSMDKRSLVGYGPWSPRESDATEHTGTNCVTTNTNTTVLSHTKLFCTPLLSTSTNHRSDFYPYSLPIPKCYTNWNLMQSLLNLSSSRAMHLRVMIDVACVSVICSFLLLNNIHCTDTA